MVDGPAAGAAAPATLPAVSETPFETVVFNATEFVWEKSEVVALTISSEVELPEILAEPKTSSL